MHNGLKCTPEISVSVEFDDKTYSLVLKPAVDEKFTAKESCQFTEEALCVCEPSIEASLLKEVKRNLNASNWMVYHFHDTSATAPMRWSEIADDYHVGLRADAANIAPFLLHLKNHPVYCKNYAKIVNAVQFVIPFFEDFDLKVCKSGPVEDVKLCWRQKKSDYPMQPYHLSDGSIRFICLATALLQPNLPPLMVIDEPELGIHPSALEILAELIQLASRRTQVIVATQSPKFVDEFTIDDLIVAKRQDGASVFERLDEKDYNVFLENERVGALWAMNIIEGDSVHE